MSWGCALHTAFEATNFYLPRAVLDVVSDGKASSGDVLVKPGECVDDQVVRGLVVALNSAFAEPQRPNTLFLDHVGWALAAHCAAKFVECRPARDIGKGCLAPWQERLAKEMIEARLGGDIRLSDLAVACRLSVTHFARAFRQSTSIPPHRWLVRRRIERVQNLLLNTNCPIADIALDCGFHDQSHLTTVFNRIVGTSPAAWRRSRRS